MLLRWSLGLVLLAAMIAQSFCQCSVGRKLEEVDEDSKSLQYVSTAQDFTDALKDGVRHVVVTEHLDLSGFSKKLSTSTCGFEETTSTVSIQGQCEGSEPPSTEQPLPSPSTCVLDIHEDFLELSNATTAVSMAHLYVRLQAGSSRASSTYILQRSPRLWMTNMVLEGDGQVVRGVEADTGSRLYMENVTLSRFSRSFGSAVKLNANVTAALYSILFTENTVQTSSEMSQDFGPDLYVGSRSSALLNNITFTELTSEQEGAPPGERARIAVYNGDTSTVFSRSGGEPGQTGGGQEVGAAVFERGNDISSTTTTQAVPGNLLARFPSLQDPEYIAIVQEREDAVSMNPFLRAEEEASPDAADSGSGEEASDDETGLNIGDGAGSLQLPLWALIVGILVVFTLLIILLGMLTWCVRKRHHFRKDAMFGSSHNTSTSLLHAKAAARSAAVSTVLDDTSLDLPMRASGALLTRSGALPSRPTSDAEGGALMSGSGLLTNPSAAVRTASGTVGSSLLRPAAPIATLGSDRLVPPLDTARRSSGAIATTTNNNSSTLITSKSMRSDNNNTQSMVLTPRSPDVAAEPFGRDACLRPSSTSHSINYTSNRPQTNTSTYSQHRRTGSVGDVNYASTAEGGSGRNVSQEPPVQSASTSSSVLGNSVPVATLTETGSAGDRSGLAGGTPLTPYTDTASHPFKATHELSPMAGGTPSAGLAQWPQELEAALDNMAATNQAFLGRYTLHEASSRLRSQQGIVAFATCKVTNQQVALKFFLNNGRFLRDEALFQQSALRPLMQAVLSMHSNAQGAITYGPYAFPPCIIMSRGESLKAWIRSETRSFHQVCVVLLQLASWLELCHQTGFAHRNIKPSNVIQLSGSGNITVVDYGASARIGTKIAMCKSIRYAPPEAILTAEQNHTTVPSDPAADIWAYGAITYELATGKSMFSGFHAASDIRGALAGRAPFPWESSVGVNATGCFSKIGGLRRVLKWCLCRDPAQRPTAHALVAEITTRMRAAETASSSSAFKRTRTK